MDKFSRCLQFSIITIARNNLTGLKRTADSVLSQDCRSFEWIVVDGDSVDGSKEYLKHFSFPDWLRVGWSSEPDEGIYDAMNKGIARAEGKYCLFLNSGDQLYSDDVLSSLELGGKLDADIIVCNLNVSSEANKSKNGIRQWDAHALGKRFFYNRTLPHQSTLIKRDLFQRFGNYDPSFKIKGDHDFFVRAYLGGSTVRNVPVCLCTYYLDGISSAMKHGETFKRELQIIRDRHFSKTFRMITNMLATLKKVRNDRA
jgi:glycosyltransferase involved in cell wall biosynthesis